MRDYPLGYSEAETRRLDIQAVYLAEMTTDLLKSTGLCQGMSVLDIGTGTGDVARLAAEIVGPDGYVLGIDRNADILAHARDRTRAQVSVHFREGGLAGCGTFDLVVGRAVLLFQPDRAAFVREAAACVKPGGHLAFAEVWMDDQAENSTPPIPSWDSTLTSIRSALIAARAHTDTGARLQEIFTEAGLPEPVSTDRIVTSDWADESFIDWVVLSMEHLCKSDRDTGGKRAPSQLRRAIQEQARLHGAILRFPPIRSAWARIG